VDDSALGDGDVKKMLASVTRRTRFVVPVHSIEQGRALADGHAEPLLGGPKPSRPAGRRKTATSIGR
jgi:hypothetical protein